MAAQNSEFKTTGIAGKRLLAIYLNDHHAGATIGWELAKRTLAENQGSPFQADLEGLCRQIREDRETLRHLMGDLGIAPTAWKAAVGWLAEKVSRLKGNGQLRGYSPLSRLTEIEALALGVNGKASMWRTLLGLSDKDPRLRPSDLEALIRRAQEQLSLLERLRSRAAAAAFAPGAPDETPEG